MELSRGVVGGSGRQRRWLCILTPLWLWRVRWLAPLAVAVAVAEAACFLGRSTGLQEGAKPSHMMGNRRQLNEKGALRGMLLLYE